METKRKILLVDDTKQILAVYSDFFKARGYEVATADNGKDALLLAAKTMPDIILLDVMMPGTDGGTVATQLAANIRTRRIPVVFLTSLVSDEEAASCAGEIGGRMYISKSCPPDLIAEKVKSVLDKY